MTIEAIHSNPSLNNSDISIFPEIVGALYIENHYYPITISRNGRENSGTSTASLEVSRFEIDGQFYIVLTTEPISTDIDLDPTNILTERELEIAILVALGRQNKQIAKQLNISEWTVSSHLRRIFTKLGVGSRAAMVYRCSSLINRNLQSGN